MNILALVVGLSRLPYAGIQAATIEPRPCFVNASEEPDRPHVLCDVGKDVGEPDAVGVDHEGDGAAGRVPAAEHRGHLLD